MSDNFMTDIIRIQEQINTLQEEIRGLKKLQDNLVKYKVNKTVKQ
jgi:hypothetical protein